MGEVWKARDTHLHRDVAVKILPSELTADAELQERLQREARLIAQLNDPHICTLHDVGDGYLVMELLEGEALDDRLDRGPLPIDEVLRYGAQIAEALDRAHGKGIVHRDLKPGNIMITKSGAKLLDFGLAKSARIPIRDGETTERKPLTRTGFVVGTLQYMAPEQLTGSSVDARTDIFALGATLYQMATARPAFDGASREIMPRPVSELRPQTPPALEHVIARCLNNDPEQRWQNARDIAAELRWIATTSRTSSARGAAAPQRRWREALAWIAALLAVAAAVWIAVRPRPQVDAIAASIDGELKIETGPPSFSPDGKWLAYVSPGENGQSQIWLRSMERDVIRALPGTSHGVCPFWSPDGKSIGFTTIPGSELKTISVSDGSVQTLATGVNVGWTWNRDGVILYVGQFQSFKNNSLYRVPAGGGKAVEILPAASLGASLVGWPLFLPDGNHFLFVLLRESGEHAEEYGLWVATLDGSEKPRFLTRARSHVAYVDSGYLVFARDGVLRAQRFDAKTLQLRGEEVAIAPVQHFVAGKNALALFAASHSGLLAWQPPAAALLSELIVMNRNGEIVRKLGDAARYDDVRISPDGRRIAVQRIDPKTDYGDVWLADIDDGTASRSSFDPLHEATPVWSVHSDAIAYALHHRSPERSSIVRKGLREQPRTIADLPGLWWIEDWSGSVYDLALRRFHPQRKDFDLSVWSIPQQKLIDITTSPANEWRAVFSPDGKWLAYESDEGGRPEIYVQPYPPTGAKYLISPAGGSTPRWRRDNEITYAGLNDRIQVVKLETTPVFRSGTPQELFRIERSPWVVDYDVTASGTFVTNVALRGQPQPMKLLVNWTRRLDESK